MRTSSSIVNPGSFYLRTTFITLSMLVVGGMNSLSGAVSGVVVISALIEMFRDLEKGVSFGGLTARAPERAFRRSRSASSPLSF